MARHINYSITNNIENVHSYIESELKRFVALQKKSEDKLFNKFFQSILSGFLVYGFRDYITLEKESEGVDLFPTLLNICFFVVCYLLIFKLIDLLKFIYNQFIKPAFCGITGEYTEEDITRTIRDFNNFTYNEFIISLKLWNFIDLNSNDKYGDDASVVDMFILESINRFRKALDNFSIFITNEPLAKGCIFGYDSPKKYIFGFISSFISRKKLSTNPNGNYRTALPLYRVVSLVNSMDSFYINIEKYMTDSTCEVISKYISFLNSNRDGFEEKRTMIQQDIQSCKTILLTIKGSLNSDFGTSFDTSI